MSTMPPTDKRQAVELKNFVANHNAPLLENPAFSFQPKSTAAALPTVDDAESDLLLENPLDLRNFGKSLSSPSVVAYTQQMCNRAHRMDMCTERAAVKTCNVCDSAVGMEEHIAVCHECNYCVCAVCQDRGTIAARSQASEQNHQNSLLVVRRQLSLDFQSEPSADDPAVSNTGARNTRGSSNTAAHSKPSAGGSVVSKTAEQNKHSAGGSVVVSKMTVIYVQVAYGKDKGREGNRLDSHQLISAMEARNLTVEWCFYTDSDAEEIEARMRMADAVVVRINPDSDSVEDCKYAYRDYTPSKLTAILQRVSHAGVAVRNT